MTGPGLATATTLVAANPTWPPEMLDSLLFTLLILLPLLLVPVVAAVHDFELELLLLLIGVLAWLDNGNWTPPA